MNRGPLSHQAASKHKAPMTREDDPAHHQRTSRPMSLPPEWNHRDVSAIARRVPLISYLFHCPAVFDVDGWLVVEEWLPVQLA